MNEITCAHCAKVIEVLDSMSRRAECPSCGGDLHSCVQCRHYDARAYNECREPQAERVVEKSRANYCDFFAVQSEASVLKEAQTKNLRAQAEALFKPKK